MKVVKNSQGINEYNIESLMNFFSNQTFDLETISKLFTLIGAEIKEIDNKTKSKHKLQILKGGVSHQEAHFTRPSETSFQSVND